MPDCFSRPDRPAILERGLGLVPRPADDAWCRRALDLIYEADCAAREATGLEPTPRRSFGQRTRSRPLPAARARPARRCVGCGGPLDAEAPGCGNCRARHGMRLLKERRAVERFHVVGAVAAVAAPI